MDAQLQQIIDRAVADGLGDDDIDLLVQEHKARTPVHGPANQVTARPEDFMDVTDKPNVYTQGVGKSVVQAGVGAAKNLGGMIPALIHAVMNPMEAGKEMANAQFDTFAKGNDTSKGIVERGAYKAAGLIPFLGPMAATAGERIGSGEPEKMGAGATDVAMMASASPMIRSGVKAGAKAVAPTAGKAVATVKAAASHPVAKAAVGAGLGYAHGGLLGAAEGAVGGGILAKILKIIEKQPGGETASAKPVDPMAKGMAEAGKEGRRIYEDLSANDRMKARMSEAGRAANPNAGGRVSPTPTVGNAVGEALRDMKGERTGKTVVSPTRSDLPGAVGRRTNEAAVESSTRTSAESRQMLKEAMEKREAARKAADEAHRASIVKEAEELQAPIVQKIAGGNGEHAALNAERDAISQAAKEEAQIGNSKSKAARGADNKMSPNDRKVFADNIRNGMTEEEAIADMLRQRAERATANYGRESAAAAARRKQQPILPELQDALLNSLKQRTGQ